MTWAQVKYVGKAGLPWALVDPRGRILLFAGDPRVARALSHVCNRALHLLLEDDGDTCPILVRCGLTRANGELTDAGFEWLTHTEVPDNIAN